MGPLIRLWHHVDVAVVEVLAVEAERPIAPGAADNLQRLEEHRPRLLVVDAVARVAVEEAAASDAVDNEALLVEAVLAEEELGRAVAVDVNGVDQLETRGHVEARRVGDAGGKLLRHTFKVHPGNDGDVTRNELCRRRSFAAGRQVAAGGFRTQHDHGVIAHV